MEPLREYMRHGLEEGLFPRSLDREIAGLSNPDLVKWIGDYCTQFLSSATTKGFPETPRETVIEDIRRATAGKRAEDPAISIIVPVYNNVDFTLICIASVLKSNPRRSFQLIVADDVSTDSTKSIFEHLPWPIRYVRWESKSRLFTKLQRSSNRVHGPLSSVFK